ncbi:type I polyketide synthase [Naumannella halotolerans]|uniref:Acyl transferase domain-containing protein n=1 Tax=Naumannella halotolerans TaxID=993414 RepID=A0A4R7IZF1_9ACTN|nr:type I polyketide synthase [Naumannella halotolerans]TDT30094.1 acyl transferase domain-containing protein [Naumannella halotolerans]
MTTTDRTRDTSGHIAVIGIGCHFPGHATDPQQFWDLLTEASDATRTIPADRWEVDKFYDPERSKIGKTHVSRGGFLDRVDEFDAHFFGISPREAVWLDPQQRLLLRVAYESLEDAGQDLNALAGSDVGVYMGGFTLDYQLLQNYGIQSRYELQAHSATGMMMTMLSNRLSHAFNFTGPSMSIDTACSSSLVAVHLATQAIQRGECNMAIAGGVNVMLAPNMTIAESKGGFLSPDGRCKTFDASADGYGRAEGAGVVVLKSLEQALEDNDSIYSVIMGTAVSQDGRTDGITVPNGDAQVKAIKAAHAVSGVRPDQIQYVEAHGTGTPVGDPIEASAIGAVLSEGRSADEPIILGSVKTNIGHMEAAAGVAGLIKTSLALRNKTIPPHLHLTDPNPDVPFEEYNLLVPTQGMEWPQPKNGGVRIAGVNSFGFGGTNAHVVVSEAPTRRRIPTEPAKRRSTPWLIPISARHADSLAKLASRMTERVQDADDDELDQISYTAALRRTHHEHRAVVVADSASVAAERFSSVADLSSAPGVAYGTAPAGSPKVAFVCTGMGPQWWGMGRQLFESEPLFRAAVERCSDELEKYTGWSLVDELLADEDVSRMAETEVAQPANFAIQVGLAELWKQHGVEPDAIVGHSTGELAAQYLAGVLSLREAIRVTYHRSRLQQRATGTGRMLAVGLSPETLDKAVDEAGPGVSVAAVNGPSAVTMSGDAAALENMASQLQTFGVFHKFLQVKIPYHSHLMEPLRDELVTSLSDLEAHSATIPLYSTVTGTRIDGAAVDSQYWWQNVRATVLFAAAFSEMIDDGYTHFIELGPHTVLASSMKEVLDEHDTEGVVVASMRRGAHDQTTFYSALGALHCAGHEIAWETVCTPRTTPTGLPTYPWQLVSYWNESREALEDRHHAHIHPLLGSRINAPNPTWEIEVGSRWLPGVTDHQIQGTTIVPGAALIEMFHAAATDTYVPGEYAVHDVELLHAIALDPSNDPRLRTTLYPAEATVEIAGFRALPNGDRTWTVHARARISRASKNNSQALVGDPASSPARIIDGEEFYDRLTASGFEYGPMFRTITSICDRGDAVTATVLAPADVVGAIDNYTFHPVLLDAALQLLLVRGLPASPEASSTPFLPVGIESVTVHQRPTNIMNATAYITSTTSEAVTCDVILRDPEGALVAEITGYTARSLEATTGGSPDKANKALYRVDWQEVTSPPAPMPSAEDWPGETFAVFADRRGVGECLANELTGAGKTVIKIHAEPTVAIEIDDKASSVRLNPADADQYTSLARYLFEQNVDHIIHLWATDTTADTDIDGASILQQQTLAAGSVYRLSQAMLTANQTAEWKLWLVSCHGQAISASDTVSPTQAAIWGAGRVLGHQEMPSSWGGLIDVDGESIAQDVSDIILAATTEGTEDHNAFRNGSRYVARLDKVPHQGTPFPLSLRPDVSYLITGGLGALGGVVARYLAQRGARNITLISRNGLPDRSQWVDLDPNHPRAGAVERIRKLEDDTGCQVEVAAVDVTDEEALRQWKTSRSGAPIAGVIHAAGVVDDSLVQHMTHEQFHRVLQPKITGSWNLHQVFDDSSLDFFMMFSSTGAVIASPGQINYASANAFIDALAHLRRSQGRPAVSLGWGPWSIGMVEDLHLESLYSRLGIDLITPQMGEAVMARYLIDSDAAHVVVVSADWTTARKSSPTGELPALFQRLDNDHDEDRTGSLVATVLAAPEEQRTARVTEVLRDITATVLALDPEMTSTTESLNTFGLDSMMAIEIRNRLQVALEVDVPVLDLLHGVTIGDLAVKLTDRIGAGTSTADDLAGGDTAATDAPIHEADLDDEQVDEELARLIADISDEDIALLLSEADSTPSGEAPHLSVVRDEQP